MTSFKSRLQSSLNTVLPGLFNLKAWAAGSSFSMAQRDSAIPAWWNPSDKPKIRATNEYEPQGQNEISKLSTLGIFN